MVGIGAQQLTLYDGCNIRIDTHLRFGEKSLHSLCLILGLDLSISARSYIAACPRVHIYDAFPVETPAW